ncbi:TLC [Musa troglodytarum]|uniref:TLC n=1 Tax=Musa troglodytarum TaxID=320322 RepID=A0A9E7ES32_9LILI|nr:TLC [Musa troglodytarum]
MLQEHRLSWKSRSRFPIIQALGFAPPEAFLCLWSIERQFERWFWEQLELIRWRATSVRSSKSFGLYQFSPALSCAKLLASSVYDLTRKISTVHFKGYDKLSRLQRIEWNNRGFSTFHAIVVAAVSFYLLVVSDLFKSGTQGEFVINRKSFLSDTIFGISLGYFLSDLAMILWHFPSLGGKEYVLHHGLSMFSIFLSLVSGKAHMYILMILLTETTTPFVNLRWYLDLAGQKSSNLYLYNGCKDPIVHLFLHAHISSPSSGEDNISSGVLHSFDSISNFDIDESILVLENTQGHDEDSFQKEARALT